MVRKLCETNLDTILHSMKAVIEKDKLNFTANQTYIFEVIFPNPTYKYEEKKFPCDFMNAIYNTYVIKEVKFLFIT